MIEILLGIIILLLIANLWLTFRNSAGKNATVLTEIKNSIGLFDNSLSRVDKSIKDDFQRNREESHKIAKENRSELTQSLKLFSDAFSTNVKDFNALQKQKFDELSLRQSDLNKTTEQKLDKIRETVESKLHLIQEDNAQKLEKMRETVDEKLHKTLEHRLGESFKLVSERLEKVQQGLGEMQSLASGVGDLKKVLANVKTRGVLGEYQLENILEQLLTLDQYAKNVKTKEGSDSFVEFAIKLPGRKDKEKVVWLPIDSKFPIENYQILLQAYDQSDTSLIEAAQKELSRSIRLFAKDVREKYIDPPNTTDFAIIFLPVEGLYAEVLRDAGLFESLQREYKIIVTGPTTLSALLNSLQMGFRTLAIEKRSSEVWEILAAVKTEFGKFGDVLDRTKKKLQEASNVVDKAGVRSRAIERKLESVEGLPSRKAAKYLATIEEENDLNSKEEESEEENRSEQ